MAQDLTPKEFDELDELLAHTPGDLEAMDVAMLDGYLCGILVQPDVLPMAEWLPPVLDAESRPLPADAFDRQVVRAMAFIVACDIHPVNNLRILKALAGLGVEEPARNSWARRWISEGFAALEPMIARHGAGYAFGDAPTLADACLVPQVYNAARFAVDLTPFPAIAAAAARAGEHPAIAAAHPNLQPDAIS